MRGKLLRPAKQLRAFFRYLGRNKDFVQQGDLIIPRLAFEAIITLLPDGTFVTRAGNIFKVAWYDVEYVGSEQ